MVYDGFNPMILDFFYAETNIVGCNRIIISIMQFTSDRFVGDFKCWIV